MGLAELDLDPATLAALRTQQKMTRIGPLDNLDAKPTKLHPKATFVYSSDGYDPAGLPTLGPYPALAWTPQGDEIRITSADHREALAEEYPDLLDAPPLVTPKTRTQSASDLLAGLSDDERTQVLAAARSQRLEALQASLALLSDAELAAVTGAGVVRRGPGRPPKHGDRS